jgi:hypothetical protein
MRFDWDSMSYEISCVIPSFVNLSTYDAGGGKGLFIFYAMYTIYILHLFSIK